MSTAIIDQINNIKLMSREVFERESVKDREYRRLKAFNKIIVKSNESKNQRELLQGILDASIDFVDFDLGGIYLLTGNTAHIVVSKFIPSGIIHTLDEVCAQRPELKDLFNFGKAVYIRDYHIKHPQHSQLLGGIQTLISLPILYNNQVKGCVNIASFNDKQITDDDCDILRTLGKHLGHVLHRFEVEQQLELKLTEVEAYTEELRATLDQYREMVERLEESQQQLDIERHDFMTLYNRMHDMVFVISYAGNIVSVNDAVKNRLGYNGNHLLGKPITYVHDYADQDQMLQNIRDIIDGQLNQVKLKLYSKNGEIVNVDARITIGLWNGVKCIFSVDREV